MQEFVVGELLIIHQKILSIVRGELRMLVGAITCGAICV